MKKVAFVHIPKTAGGSIKHWFTTNNPSVEFYASNHTFLDKVVEEHGPMDFSFTCVRNIYDKMISFYNWQGPKHLKKHKKSLKSYGSSPYEDEVKAYYEGIIPFMEYARSKKDIMTISQTEWITGVDHIVYFDNIIEDFKIVQQHVNCYVPLEKTKHISNYVAKDFFTKDFKLKVEELFADEIDYFNWKPKY